MSKINRNSNTAMTDRFRRLLQHGQNELKRSKSFNPSLDTKTYYLLEKTMKIISYREWYQKGKPEYISYGSKQGVEGYKKRVSELVY